MVMLQNDDSGAASRGYVDDKILELTGSLTRGEILIPQITPSTPNIAGGQNHCPNSDLSYSRDAVETVGTVPGTAGDANQQAWRFYRQLVGANMAVDAAHSLKAVGESTYAASEGANAYIPIWNRVDGWAVLGGATGNPQYDVAVQLSKIVGPGQPWFFRCRVVSLDPTLVPADLQLYAGLWVKSTSAGTEGWAAGGAFTLNYTIAGTPGTTSTEYRVLAKTDSGVSILSNVLVVATAPDVLSTNDYIKLFFTPGRNSGFIDFEIYRLRGGVYKLVGSVRNSTDLQFNDIGADLQAAGGWPSGPGNAPLAYAESGRSRTLKVGAYGADWAPNDLTIQIPTTYNFSQTDDDGQFLRFGLTSPTAVDRHIGIDRIWWSQTYNEWSADLMPPFLDRTYPIPSIGPTSGHQGGGTGVIDPPEPGGGGETCIAVTLPVLVKRARRLSFRPYKATWYGDGIKGEHTEPYVVLDKVTGTVSEYFVIKTANGITYECSGPHRLIANVKNRTEIEARRVKIGDTLACWTRGRQTTTKVKSIKLIPKPLEVGTYSLRHPAMMSKDGRGMYIAGRSRNKDRGLFSSNRKNEGSLLI